MKAELCKTCIHTKMCFHDKNLVGDTFVCGFFDADDAWEKYKEWEKARFPCDDYYPVGDTFAVVRCMDCVHYNPLDSSRPWDCPVGMSGVCPNDYCSKGEPNDHGRTKEDV